MSRRVRQVWDHPRSRGENHCRQCPCADHRGPSPLAWGEPYSNSSYAVTVALLASLPWGMGSRSLDCLTLRLPEERQ